MAHLNAILQELVPAIPHLPNAPASAALRGAPTVWRSSPYTGAVAGKETGRRDEGDGEVWEKSPEMRHSVVFSCPEEAELAPS